MSDRRDEAAAESAERTLNPGIITGASGIRALFTLASGTIDITMARPEAVATGMRTTFAVAAVLIMCLPSQMQAGP
jgi:hypothetical protein